MNTNNWMHGASICLANTGVYAAPYTSGLVIGSVITYFGADEAQSGFLVSAELLAMSITALLVAPYLPRIPVRTLAVVGTLLLLLGHVGAIYSVGFTSLVVWRVVAGLGGGLLLAAVNAVIAQSPNPAMLFGVATMMACLLTALISPAIAQAIVARGYAGYYQVMLAMTALVLAVLCCFPARSGQSAHSRTVIKLRNKQEGCWLMLGVVVFGIAMMAYYAFIERFAVRIGFDPQSIGYLYTALLIGSAAGGGFAAYLGPRLGPIKPLIVCLIAHAVAVALAVLTTISSIFVIAVISQGCLYMLAFPLQLTLAAELDKEGRWAALIGGASFVSFSAGPVVGGWLITQFGYSAIAWSMLAITAPLIMIFLIIGARRPEGAVLKSPTT